MDILKNMIPNSKELILLNLLNNQSDIYNSAHSYQSTFLNNITPDPANARFFPAIFISDVDAKLFTERKISKKQLCEKYNAEDSILLGKSCIINCLKYASSDWKKANDNIESIIQLAENIITSEVIQAPTIYPTDNNKYQLLTGHRRFFALVFANGYESAAQFKVYETEPALIKTKQFQENASREDLPQYGKLLAFNNAILELQMLSDAKIKLGEKKLTVRETANTLGISMGAFDNYNVLTRYPSVIDLYEKKLSHSFIYVKKVVLQAEKSYKTEHTKTVLNVSDRKIINTNIKNTLLKKPKTANKNNYKLKPIQSAGTLKKILSEDITKIDMGIDWETIDWENHSVVNEALIRVVSFLEEQIN